MLYIKRMVCIALVAVGIFTLTGCEEANTELNNAVLVASNERYDVLKDSDSYFLKFNEEYSSTPSSGSLQEEDWPVFYSVKQMRESLLAGNFPASASISRKAQRNGGTLPICNLDNLFCPALPQGLYATKIYWSGDAYSFKVNGSWKGTFSLRTEEIYQERLEVEFTTVLDRVSQGKNVKVHVRTNDPEKNADVLCYSNEYGMWSIVVYTYSMPGKKLHIEESWHGACPYIQENYEELEGSGGDLVTLNVWGEQEGSYFHCTLISQTIQHKMSSDEWVQSFGLTPYVETETE